MSQMNTVQNVMRAKAGAAFLGIALSTYWKWHSQGKIPRGIRLSARATVWRKTDLEAFLLERQAASPEGAA